MKHQQYIIFCTLLHQVLGGYNITTPILKGQTKVFPLPKLPLGTINSIEWRYQINNKTMLMAMIDLNKNQSKIFSKRTGIQIMDNGELCIEDIKDLDSGNYSCTVIFHDHRMETEWTYLQVLTFAEGLTTAPSSLEYTSSPKSEPSIPDATLIALSVCSAFTILLIVATVLICKKKKCCSTAEEQIYINNTVVHKSSN